MMTEKQYRIQRLKEVSSTLKDKRIALYGIGKNAETILNEEKELNIIALIDKDHIGKYKYGKKIISLESALYLELDAIIIAAESQSEKKIVDRIAKVCMHNGIELLNMYGIDVHKVIREDIEQDILYRDLTMEIIEEQIEKSDFVCFELMGVLCESEYCSFDFMWKNIESEYFLPHFYENRFQAETQRNMFRPYDISEIYSRYLANTFLNERETKRLCKLEESYFINSIFPKVDMVSLLKKFLNKGKAISIVSYLPYSDKTIYELLSRIDLPLNIPILQENIINQTVSGGMLRKALGNDFEKKTLYFGLKDSLGYWIARSYRMNRCMIKSSWEFMRDLTEISINLKNLSVEKMQVYNKWAVKTCNSPFFNRNFENLNSLPKKVYENDDVFEGENINLLKIEDSGKEENFEPISFAQYEKVKVSIIIPAYNHFGYTYACLKSILTNTIKVDYEILIADDCSIDLTSNIENIVSGVKVLHNAENLLFVKNCNNAAKYAKGKYIIFLNNDVQVKYNWLYPLVNLLENDEDIGMVGSKLIFPDGKLQEAGGIVWKDGSAANYGRNKDYKSYEYNYVKEVDYVSGASLMIRKDLWREIGGFDERYAPAYYEDTDLAFEVRRFGKKVIYQPASVIVHFEGASNGKNIQEGIKKYQEINRLKFVEKWKNELMSQNDGLEKDIFSARERKQHKKTVLFISGIVPAYDKDAGSKSILNYMKLFLKKNYIVKFLPMDFHNAEPYTFELQQMGIEVLYGSRVKCSLGEWLIENQGDIEYSFINYPNCAYEIIDLLKLTTIKIRYYGHDLHFLRLRREYEINNDKTSLRNSEIYLKKEKEIIKKSDCVYYPSDIEIEIVKNQFGKKHAKQISLFMYSDAEQENYNPLDREGIMFIGGSHPPNEDAMMWFLTEIYPDIYNAKKIPFYLLGSGQSPKLKQLKTEGLINRGYVTEEELLDLYHNIRLVVIPLRYGAGIKGKVLDALYHGVPVVSTSIGIEGIPEARSVIGAFDTAEEFKRRVLSLYDDYQTLKEISSRSKRIIKEYFSLEAAWKKIEEDF